MKLKIVLTAIACLFSISSCQDHDNLKQPSESKTESEARIPDNLEISEAEICNIVSFLFPEKTNSRAAQDYTFSTICSAAGIPAIHVINFRDDQGFLLLSATKTHNPILAYNSTGNYSLEFMNRPEAIMEWEELTINDIVSSLDSDEIEPVWNTFATKEQLIPFQLSRATQSAKLEQINKVVADSLASWRKKGFRVLPWTEYVPQNAEEERYINDIPNNIYWECMENWEDYVFVVINNYQGNPRIDDLLKSKWNQTYPYNNSFPTYDGINKCAVGCGSVALGQIMKYHKKPANYNWDNMPLVGANATTSDFLYDLAKRSDAKIGESTSTTIEGNKKALTSYGYTCVQDGYDHKKVVSEIIARRPVFATGFDGDDGHAWVISGLQIFDFYDEIKLYHVNWGGELTAAFTKRENVSYFESVYCNWGWGGSYDGYFSYDKFRPGDKAFTERKKMLYQIK